MLANKVLEFVAALRAGDIVAAGKLLLEILAIVFADDVGTMSAEDKEALKAAIGEAEAALNEPSTAGIGDGKLLKLFLAILEGLKLFL